MVEEGRAQSGLSQAPGSTVACRELGLLVDIPCLSFPSDLQGYAFLDSRHTPVLWLQPPGGDEQRCETLDLTLAPEPAPLCPHQGQSPSASLASSCLSPLLESPVLATPNELSPLPEYPCLCTGTLVAGHMTRKLALTGLAPQASGAPVCYQQKETYLGPALSELRRPCHQRLGTTM